MVIEKEIPSRIQHKHDTEANWKKAVNFIPKIGEFIVYDKDSTHDYQRVKVGDGSTLLNNLPFISISEEVLAATVSNLQTLIGQNELQISATKPSFACTWFRVKS